MLVSLDPRDLSWDRAVSLVKRATAAVTSVLAHLHETAPEDLWTDQRDCGWKKTVEFKFRRIPIDLHISVVADWQHHEPLTDSIVLRYLMKKSPLSVRNLMRIAARRPTKVRHRPSRARRLFRVAIAWCATRPVTKLCARLIWHGHVARVVREGGHS